MQTVTSHKFKVGDRIQNIYFPAKEFKIIAKNNTHYLFEDRGCLDIRTTDSEYERISTSD